MSNRKRDWSTTRLQRYVRWAFILVSAAVLNGCAAVGPDYVRPEIELPQRWQHDSGLQSEKDEEQLASWWQVIGDPVLTGLIERAVADNLDLKQAVSRVRETRLQRVYAKSSLFPELTAGGSIRKRELHSEDGAVVDAESYAAQFDASWELDIFGGVRRSVEAAEADLAAQTEDLHDALVTLTAEVALNYIELRTYQKRLEFAASNVASQQETWQLLEAVSQAGRGDELALTQARYNLESSKSRIPSLETGLEETMNRLAVLLGKPAGKLNSELQEAIPLPDVSIKLAVGVPANILRQRPDIRQAERQLAAQTARVGEAEADLYPRFSLSGSIGLETISLDKLLSGSGRFWSFGPSFSWPIFQAGAIRSNIKIQGEKQQQAFLSYESVILSALEEVENSLLAYAKEQERLESLRKAASAASLAADLAGHQYATGMTGFSDVLDAQRSLISFEDELAQSKGEVLADLVRMYKALGGGWQTYQLELTGTNNDTSG